MSKKKSSPPRDSVEEITGLVDVLRETEQRLEELTAGEIDSVADRDGRMYLLRRAQEQLRRHEAIRQAAILNALPAHIALLDAQGVIVSVNEAWRRFGSSTAIQGPGYAVGLNYPEICDSARGDGSAEAHQAAEGIRSVLSGAVNSFSIEYPCHTPSEQRWLLLSVTPLSSDYRDGAIAVHLNITEQKRARDALKQVALQTVYSVEHDFLTGLPNRTLLNDRVGQAIALARRHMTQFAVLFLDLDGFKDVNDSRGHAIGDKLLQSIAIRLVNCVRGSDTVTRQGGDEFVVMLTELQQSEDAAITAKRMLAVVAQPHVIDAHELHITASIGVSVYPDDGLDADTLIKNADTAMYQAKENGRHGYRFFKPAMNVPVVERQFIEANLPCALERQEFTLHYQPKINLRTGAINGAEARIRWTHPIRGPIAPAQFIPVAENCGLIVPIGNWVLREASAQARVWANAGLPPATMAVNISAMEFCDENFVESVLAILKNTGLGPRSLGLELTESILRKRTDSTVSNLQTLRESGLQIMVDEFGTGYSSLSYLQKFPIDAVKIDQSLIRQIAAAGATSIVSAAISMARSLNLRVSAEGVETQEELACLKALQCDEAQGNYFSQPVPAQQFASLLRTGIAKPSRVSADA